MARPLGALVALALTVGATSPGAAQERVRLVVAASPPVTARGERRPLVATPNLIRDARWREALQNSFPLRLRFRVEIWRVRPDWFDALERAFDWEELIQYEPLADQYSLLVISGGSARGTPERYASLQELEQALEVTRQVEILPASVGEYFFTASLQIRTLTDEEMEDLERFLQGQPTPRDDPNPRGSPLGRAARRLLLRFGGLPHSDLQATSARFTVGGGSEEQR